MIIHLQTSRWRPGQRLAIGGATAALVAAVAWASLGERASSMRTAPVSVAPVVAPGAFERRIDPFDTSASVRAAARAFAPSPVVAEGPTVPPMPPFQYVGHWKKDGVTTVVLSDRGRNLLVRVPGAFDDRYHIVSVDENRLVLKVLPLGAVQMLTLSPGAAWTMREPVRTASPTAAVAAPAAAPEPEAPWARTSVRRKPGDAESSMEVPGLPVASPAAFGAAAHAASPSDAEPEN